MYFLVVTANGDRHSRSDGGSDRPRGRGGPKPSLPEGRQAKVVSQVEELKRELVTASCYRGSAKDTEGGVQQKEGA